MVRIGYHVSHEQYAPRDLLQYVQQAEAAGFAHAMSSDHLAPFSERQGHSGFAWSWLGAAMATTSLSFGIVNAPGQRYHPAIIAQAIATLASMFEGRFWAAFGSGQYINEQVTGEGWPIKADRNARLLECVEIIRALLHGQTVTRFGHITITDGKLYELPEQQPLLFGAAITPETAGWVAQWADGLITVYQPNGKMAETVQAFRRNGGEGKPIYLQAQHAYAPDGDEALRVATEQWAHSVLSSRVMTDLATPGHIDDASALAKPEDVAERVRISCDVSQHLQWLREYEELGFDAVYVHNVVRRQREFIDAFGEHVLPHFAR